MYLQRSASPAATCSGALPRAAARRSCRRPTTVRCSTMDFMPEQPGLRKASKIPTPDEDRDVAHSAFMHAFENAKPEHLHIPGMQEFAGAILARQHIPSQQYSDPLMHIFNEFDTDGDGHLTAHEVAAALRSRNVNISDEQAEMFVDVVDTNQNHQVERDEFRHLILHMAAADLHSRQEVHNEDQDGAWVQCSWEEDEEIQTRLKGWVDNIMVNSRYH